MQKMEDPMSALKISFLILSSLAFLSISGNRANNVQMQGKNFIPPTKEGVLTSKFGLRIHPIIKKIRKHPGIDIRAQKGTNVYAVKDGTVQKIITTYKQNRGYGKFINLAHEGNFLTRYAHLDSILVKKGQKVKKGNLIGLVGQTGLATGPLLHFELLKDMKKVDPENYIDFTILLKDN